MSRRVYKFMLKTLKEVSFVGTRYYPVELDANVSPYTTVLATIWDEEHMVGQVNQTEILAWWSELYQEPKQALSENCMESSEVEHMQSIAEQSVGIILAKAT